MLEDQLNHAGNLIRIKTEAEDLETLKFCDKDLVEQSEICHLKSELKDIEKANKVKNEIANKLSKELNEIKLRFRKGNVVLHKAHRVEIKSWRKELGK